LLDIFQLKHGHVRQKDGFPVNGLGEFQPWLTYPMIEFLNGFDFSNKTVFEYGSGASTLFWATRAKEVISIEFDGEWHQSLLSKIPKNVTLIHEPDGRKYASSIQKFSRQFDVIVIDGAERNRCAIAAINSLKPGGMIILDNAEWYPNTAGYLASAGLIEIPFSGFSPVNAFCSTSTAFLTRDFAFPQKIQSRRPPVGGRALPAPAFDDVMTSANEVARAC
jgi:hypothetical protein